ncbi:MAG TPA: OFA family MFS transporter [Polyangiaceae bacterium]|nr:OFA family MFS transporter [Polyangiaceae bacterium]
MEEAKTNRWFIAIMGTTLQLCLGTVYAWSYFQKPLCDTYKWSNTQVAWAFSLAICFLGLAAAWGGIKLPKLGPRKLAMMGGALFGIGYLLGALALHLQSLPLLYIGYGVIGGSGLGLGYVTPVATVSKWFPDKPGFSTGMVVMGFGFGALLMSKFIAPFLMDMTGKNLVTVFAYMGVLFLVLTLPVGYALKNPPAGYVPAGWTPPATAAGAAKADESLTVRESVTSGRFAIIWLIFFCNIAAGISIIGFQSPLMQDRLAAADPTMTKEALAAGGATLIAITSLFNGVGRFFWGGLSDRIGRSRAFMLMLGTQIVAFGLLLVTANPWLFGAIFCYVLLCYGGGFGTMPAFIRSVFGARLQGAVYGTVLTAWSVAGIVGPQVVAFIKDKWKDPAQASQYSFMAAIAFIAVGFLLTFIAKDTAFASKAAAAPEASKAA